MGVEALLSAAGERALADAAALAGSPDLVALERLAAAHGGELARLAWTQVGLRTRATDKLGPGAESLLLTADGLEQATRWEVARHRTARLRGREVVDLCCGIGGELRALSGLAAGVLGVDRDPEAVACARHNAPTAEVLLADVREVSLPPGAAVVVDPARRSGGRRVFDPAGYAPPWAFVEQVLSTRDAVAKVAPGIPHALVPAGVEAEWVSWRGGVKEAALWSGGLATPGVGRRATLLTPEGADTLVGSSAGAPTGPPGRWLHEPDGAVVRAGLVAEAAALVDGRLLDATTAYVTTDGDATSPFTRRWEVLESLPFGMKRLRAVLRARGVGAVEVKKRGSALDVEQARAALRGPGSDRATVVLCRLGGRPWALVCAPQPSQAKTAAR